MFLDEFGEFGDGHELEVVVEVGGVLDVLDDLAFEWGQGRRGCLGHRMYYWGWVGGSM